MRRSKHREARLCSAGAAGQRVGPWEGQPSHEPRRRVLIRIIATRGSDELLKDAPLERLPALLSEPGTFVWVNITPPVGDVELSLLTDTFRFHPLAIEDCFEARTHPKIDEYEGYLYLITHGLSADSTAESGNIVELDAFVSARYLVTHHDQFSRSVAAVTEYVLKSGFPLRHGPINVLHALLDRQVEGLEEQLDEFEERIAQIEDAVFENPANTHIASLLAVKRSILQLRRWMAKQREVVLRLGRREFALVPANEAMLFRDVHDHLVRINDLLENFREMLTAIQEAYLSVTSNRLGEIMKFLTVFTAMLMPLTVITGIYGMNFEHMPELRERLGYPAVLATMAAVSGSMLFYFRRRGWLGSAPSLLERPEALSAREGERPPPGISPQGRPPEPTPAKDRHSHSHAKEGHELILRSSERIPAGGGGPAGSRQLASPGAQVANQGGREGGDRGDQKRGGQQRPK